VLDPREPWAKTKTSNLPVFPETKGRIQIGPLGGTADNDWFRQLNSQKKNLRESHPPSYPYYGLTRIFMRPPAPREDKVSNER